MEKSQEFQLLKMLDQGGLTKGQEFNVLKALEGDISADEALRDIYLESLKPSMSFDEWEKTGAYKKGPLQNLFSKSL